MAKYISNRNGGKTDEQGHYRFHVNAWDGNILNDGLKVKQNSPLGMSVLIEPGDVKIDYSTYGYTGWNDADEAVTIATADGSNPRIDRIVAYVDRVMTPNPSNSNNPGMLKFMSVAGTPAGSPSPVSNSTVNTAVSSNPWCELAQVQVNSGVSTITNGSITDKRTIATPKLADGAVTAGKTAFGGSYTTSEVDTGFKWVNGKTIYKKTVSLGAMPNNTIKNVAHGITTSDTFIKQEGMITNGTNTHTLPTVSNSTNTAALRISFTSTNIVLETNANWSTYTGYSTIWYTKV